MRPPARRLEGSALTAPAAPETSQRPDVSRQVRADQVRSHFRLSPQPVMAGLLFALLVAWAVAPSAGAGLAWGWCVVKWLVGALRLAEVKAYHRDAQADQHAETWHRRYVAGMALDGLTWGAVGLLFVPSGTAALDGVLLCSVAAIAAIGVFTLLGMVSSALIFVSLVLLPSVGHHLSLGTPAGWLAGLGLLMYWGVLVLEARRGAAWFIELARLRHENERIAEQHRQAQLAAEASSAAKSRFLATVSHEIRTPLNGILGLTQLMQRDVTEPSQQQHLDLVAASARHLRTIIDDIIDIARIESSGIELRDEPFDLAATVREASNLQQAAARDKGLDYQLHIAPALPQRWRGDAARVRQVLHNLLGNAVKFTQRGSIQLRVESGPVGLRFTVADTGPGVAQAALDRVFEPFEQADGAPSRAAGGAGLGLAIARRLARAMGGDVSCLQTTTAGSTFVFDMASQPVAGPPAPAAAPSPGNGARVLVVEDNPVNALVAVESLKRLGFKPRHADGGEEALGALQAEPFDLVLMDCQMPGIDGYETTRRWRAVEAEQGRARLPIVAVTANAATGDRERCLESGMDDYVAKPFELVALGQVIRRNLAGEPGSR